MRRGAARRFVLLLNEAEAELVAALRELQDRLGSNTTIISRSRARKIEEALAQIAELRAAAWGRIGRSIRNELRQLADIELGFQLESYEKVTGNAESVVIPALALVAAQPIHGQSLSIWLARLKADDTARIGQAVRLAAASAAAADIVSLVRGTRDGAFRDGALQISRNSLATIVRTAFGAVPNSARAAFYEANRDLFDYTVWWAVLDGKTSLICAERHGAVAPLRPGLPIPPGRKALEPPGARPPAHMGGCRSVLGAYLAGADLPEVPTFEELFARQSAQFQKTWLGPARYQLYSTGKLRIRDFVDLQTGRELTLSELGS